MNKETPDTLGIAYRILMLMRYKGFSVKTEFGDFLGWKKQYLQKILNGGLIGMSVINTILEKFPDISARWLITGEGLMIDLQQHTRAITDFHDLRDYIHVMTPDDRRRIHAGLGYAPDDLLRWQSLASAFRLEAEARYLPKNEENRQ